MAPDSARTPGAGVCFPAGADGARSTTATGRAILADSVRGVAPELAARIEHTKDWRSAYPAAACEVVVASGRDDATDDAIAHAGLTSAHQRFRFQRDGTELPLGTAVRELRNPGFGSVSVRGAVARETDFTLRYAGGRLFGDDLRRQVDAWVANGLGEPAFGEALHRLLDNPEWLDCSDLDVAVLGAGAEMGPTRYLLRWGATVHAVDVTAPATWRRLIDIARATAGTLRLPIRLDSRGRAPLTVGGLVHPDDDTAIAAVAGADLLHDAPEVLGWLTEIDGPFTLGNYLYADGGTHMRLTMAADAIADALVESGAPVSLAGLATPTDAFAVPMECVEESRRRWHRRGVRSLLQAPLRLAGQFAPNYPRTWRGPDEVEFGLCDAIIPQQGPNYLLAKRLQRWRMTVAGAAGVPVSFPVAPATRTRSVLRNRALAAAYAGAGRFGVEVFDAETSSALMAALLVHDLRQPTKPLHVALHGGLWRSAYAPRSVLGVAAVLGMLDPRG